MNHTVNEILDLLVDGPSSFAGLYSAANRLYLPSGTTSEERAFVVGEIWDALVSMEGARWVKAWLMSPKGEWRDVTEVERARARQRYEEWLPQAGYEEMSVDEVGVWYEIQPQGRMEREKWAGPVDARHKWMLDQDVATATITVNAQDTDVATRALGEWLSSHPDIELNARTVERVDGFHLRDGTFVEGGVRLQVTYRVRGQSDPRTRP